MKSVNASQLKPGQLKLPGRGGAGAPAMPLLPTQGVFRQKPWIPWWAVPLLIAGMGVWGLVLATYASTAVRTVVIWVFSGWRPRLRLVSWEMWKSLSRYGRPVMISRLPPRRGRATGTRIRQDWRDE